MGSKGKVPAGEAACETDGCDWKAKGASRFSDAVDHRKATGHSRVPASLSDGPGDTTGKRVTDALNAARRGLR
jgi:hypothetical protein